MWKFLKPRGAQPQWKTQRLAGKAVCLTGKLECSERDAVQKLVEREAGKLVDSVTSTLDYLIVGTTRGSGPSSTEKQARKLIQKGASIRVLDEAGFQQLIVPTRDDAIAMLMSGRNGIAHWNKTFELCRGGNVDLSGVDFRKADLSKADLTHASLDECDFRGANLSHARPRHPEWLDRRQPPE